MLNTSEVLKFISEKLAKLSEWLNDKTVTEIMVDPGGRVSVEQRGVIKYVGNLMSEDDIEVFLTSVASYVRQDSKADTKSAVINASIDDLRIAGAKKPICPTGSFFTIRKHQDSNDRPTLEDLVHKKKALTSAQAEELVSLIIDQHRNCLIAGNTGSGKTTLVNAILGKLNPHERIVTIEDSRELQVNVNSVVNLLSNPATASARDLVMLAMRLRPDRLVLGETRGNETFDLLRAFNSGHEGSLSTIHANSALDALFAFEMLLQMSLPPNAQMSTAVMKEFIARSIHVVVFVCRRTEMVDGVQTVVRKVEQICLVKGIKNGEYELEEVF